MSIVACQTGPAQGIFIYGEIYLRVVFIYFFKIINCTRTPVSKFNKFKTKNIKIYLIYSYLCYYASYDRESIGIQSKGKSILENYSRLYRICIYTFCDTKYKYFSVQWCNCGARVLYLPALLSYANNFR